MAFRCKRLQRYEFTKFRPMLKMIGFITTEHGNIKAIMQDKTWTKEDGKSKQRYYSHYLNDFEKENFMKSDFYKNSIEIGFKNNKKPVFGVQESLKIIKGI